MVQLSDLIKRPPAKIIPKNEPTNNQSVELSHGLASIIPSSNQSPDRSFSSSPTVVSTLLANLMKQPDSDYKTPVKAKPQLNMRPRINMRPEINKYKPEPITFSRIDLNKKSQLPDTPKPPAQKKENTDFAFSKPQKSGDSQSAIAKSISDYLSGKNRPYDEKNQKSESKDKPEEEVLSDKQGFMNAEATYFMGIKHVEELYYAKKNPDLAFQNIIDFTKKINKMDRLFDNLLLLSSYPHYKNKKDFLPQKVFNMILLAMDFGNYLLSSNSKNKWAVTLDNLVASAGLYRIGMANLKGILHTDGQLSELQMLKLKNHPEYAAKRLDKLLFPSGLDKEVIKKAVYEAYEELDGSGYPNKITNPNTYSQILRILDMYEATTHSRSGRNHYNLPNEAMIKIIAIGRNNPDKLDRRVLQDLIRKFGGFYPVGTYVRINTGHLGRVLRVNMNNPMRPIVKYKYEVKGTEDNEWLQRMPKDEIVNLLDEPLWCIDTSRGQRGALRYEDLPEEEQALYRVLESDKSVHL
ncbi:MAG: HD domain-containing phosphohydrolase [Nanoarchaeota archaeon]|nr:hypothetical protein [Nanoarchaeota archaeon]MBU1030805.1 hypothetical protein [Nanoarchaeota archaeon]MBU1850065.1 hypothetical protein [Nanoarchaeota archaeon]